MVNGQVFLPKMRIFSAMNGSSLKTGWGRLPVVNVVEFASTIPVKNVAVNDWQLTSRAAVAIK
jgi:hypothetical protein